MDLRLDRCIKKGNCHEEASEGHAKMQLLPTNIGYRLQKWPEVAPMPATLLASSSPIEFHTLVVGHITADLGDCLCARLLCYHKAITKRVQYSNTSALPKIHHLPLLNERKPTLLAVQGCKTHRHLGKTLSIP